MKLEAAHYETPALLARRVEAVRRAAGDKLRLVLDFAWAWPDVAFGLADHIEAFPIDRPFDCAHMLIREPAFARIRDGRLAPPEGPGSGLRLDDAAVTRWARRQGAAVL